MDLCLNINTILTIPLTIVVSYLTTKFLSNKTDDDIDRLIKNENDSTEEESSSSYDSRSSKSEDSSTDEDSNIIDVYKMMIEISSEKYYGRRREKIDKYRDIMLKSNVIVINDQIDRDTYFKFIDSYNKVNKNGTDNDIYLIINSGGGELRHAMAIGNYILNQKVKNNNRKIIALVPCYAFSSATLITLCCDKIIATDYALFGPCDSQIYVNNFDRIQSAKNISDAIEYKNNKGETISEDLLVANMHIQKSKDAIKMFVEDLCEIMSYNENILFDEFFSGKYCHSEIFTAQDLIDFNVGINITISNEIPIQVFKNPQEQFENFTL